MDSSGRPREFLSMQGSPAVVLEGVDAGRTAWLALHSGTWLRGCSAAGSQWRVLCVRDRGTRSARGGTGRGRGCSPAEVVTADGADHGAELESGGVEVA